MPLEAGSNIDGLLPGSFRKLRKIESGSSIAHGNLLSSARARASVAIEPEELLNDGESTPMRCANYVKAPLLYFEEATGTAVTMRRV